MGAVAGEIVVLRQIYRKERSPLHATLDDAEYTRSPPWRNGGPCAALLRSGQAQLHPFRRPDRRDIGMRADTPKALMRKPRSYLDYLTAANRAWLQARGATFHRG